MSGDGGSALLLMPAAVLVLVILGALAVDAAVVFTAQRELANATAAAANDAAVGALDERVFYEEGRLVLIHERARQVAAEAFAARQAGWLATGPPAVEIESEPPRVRISTEATVELIFAKALPGAPATRTVRATATATAARG